MANKEKEGKPVNANAVEKELNSDTVKEQLAEKVEYHNKLVSEKERLLGELNKVETALAQNVGGMNTLQGLQNEYFVQDVPSANGKV